MPIHIKARREDIAERVIVCGDPDRVRFISNFLDNARLVNKNRGFYTYTGYYKDTPITVATHGIGASSIAIVLEELVMLGAKIIVRIGTAGSLVNYLHRGDVLVPKLAIHDNSSVILKYLEGKNAPLVPDEDLYRELLSRGRGLGLNITSGVVISNDVFYLESEEFAKKWSSIGVHAVEMECATLFTIGLIRKVKTGAVLVISNNLVLNEEKEVLGLEELQEVFTKTSILALEVLSSFKTSQT